MDGGGVVWLWGLVIVRWFVCFEVLLLLWFSINDYCVVVGRWRVGFKRLEVILVFLSAVIACGFGWCGFGLTRLLCVVCCFDLRFGQMVI